MEFIKQAGTHVDIHAHNYVIRELRSWLVLNSWDILRIPGPLYVAKLFPLRVYLSRKDLSPLFPRHNPRVTGDLFESRYYHPRDCEAYLVGRRIFPPRRKRRGNTLEFRRWMERNPSFDASKSELALRLSYCPWIDVFTNVFGIVGWTFYGRRSFRSCIRYINCLRLMENSWSWCSSPGQVLRSIWQVLRANSLIILCGIVYQQSSDYLSDNFVCRHDVDKIRAYSLELFRDFIFYLWIGHYQKDYPRDIVCWWLIIRDEKI